MTTPRRIGVLGIGNVFMSDDAIGPFVLKILESHCEFPANVVVRDVGTRGRTMASCFVDYEAMILIEAVAQSGRPGEVRLSRKNHLVRVPDTPHASPYNAGLVEALRFAELCGACPPDILLVGIVPESRELGRGLSPSVKAAVAPAISAVLAELCRLGACARARSQVTQPSIWWEETVCSESLLKETQHVPGYPG
jgi:hydrogenase maturation protease